MTTIPRPDPSVPTEVLAGVIYDAAIQRLSSSGLSITAVEKDRACTAWRHARRLLEESGWEPPEPDHDVALATELLDLIGNHPTHERVLAAIKKMGLASTKDEVKEDGGDEG